MSAALLFLPLFAGIWPVPPETLGTLPVGYIATAFYEETLFRGIVLGLLRPTGTWGAVLLSSLLFGLAHLGNILLRGNPGLIALQALGAGVEGIGLSALRLRTNTICPLLVLHALHDFFLQLGYPPVPPTSAVYSIVLLIYGIFLLRDRKTRERLQAEGSTTEHPKDERAAA